MLALNTPIQPISATLQEQVVNQTNSFIKSAADYYEHNFKEIPVLFDLSGKKLPCSWQQGGKNISIHGPNQTSGSIYLIEIIDDFGNRENMKIHVSSF